MNSPAVDIMEYLQSGGVGTIGSSSGWSLNSSREPATPDTTVTLYDGVGSGNDYEINLHSPSIQIRARGNNYRVVYAKMDEIESYLLSTESFTVGSTRYVGAWNPGGIELIGYDENDRAIIVMNINLMREA